MEWRSRERGLRRKSGNGGKRLAGDEREKPWIREKKHRNDIERLGL